jgi:hypothetical protein
MTSVCEEDEGRKGREGRTKEGRKEKRLVRKEERNGMK